MAIINMCELSRASTTEILEAIEILEVELIAADLCHPPELS